MASQNLEELDYQSHLAPQPLRRSAHVLLKIGPAAALVLSGAALCLLALAPLGWRLGFWQYGFGLYRMMPVSGFVAVVAVILSVLALARDWSQLRLRDLAILFIAVALGAALVYVSTGTRAAPFHPFTTSQPTSIIRRGSAPS
jgi:hypothetical protein